MPDRNRTPIWQHPAVSPHVGRLPSPMSGYYPRPLRMRDWRSSWVRKIADEAYRVCKAPGWNPKVVRLEGDLHMVDLAMSGASQSTHGIGMPELIFVIEIIDHPFLRHLDAMPAAPKAVKHIYRAQTRLRYLRAPEGWGQWADEARAADAWAKYLGVHDSRSAFDLIDDHPHVTVTWHPDKTTSIEGTRHA